MKYLDSTVRSRKNALGYWLNRELPGEQAHLRVKTGYFTLDGVGALQASIRHLAQQNLPISIVLGANEQATLKSDVDALAALIGTPRPAAKLCVIRCAGGLFHPKVVHLTRTDGSALAYVGSANLTRGGVNGTNIEAGLLLDSRKGDPITLLNEIAASIDDWFAAMATGVTVIAGPATTQQLVVDGVLGVVRLSPSSGAGGSAKKAGRANTVLLGPLVTFPPLAATTASAPPAGPSGSAVPPAPAGGVGAREVLVAEIGGGPRWKQANFPMAIMKGYFGVDPATGPYVQLRPVSANGTASPSVTTKVVSVPSQNYRVELSAVAGLPYPAVGRPIGVFRQIGQTVFRYRVLFPNDAGYAQLSAELKNRYTGPAHHLRRITLTAGELTAAWNACPV